LKKNSKYKKILVFTNDAGDCAYICSIILKEYNFFNWSVYAVKDSPASKLLKKNKILHTNFFLQNDIKGIIKKECPDFILYGTGVEQITFSGIIKENASKYNIQSIAVIDHWSNYKERFPKNTFPDAILTFDYIAYQLAKKIFNKSNIFQIKNYYVENLYQEFINQKSFDMKYVTFISEPIKKKSNSSLSYECRLVNNILKKFDEVIIRLHPSEKKDKYDELISNHKGKNIVKIDPYKESLSLTLSKSKLTIGINSYALYISYIFGIQTISCIPNTQDKKAIPIPEKYILNTLDKIDKVNFNNNRNFMLNENSLSFKSFIEQEMKCIH
tara:strand:+ start:3331 stop:4314 length:984 start_codon:yes stop_codon:yes gene_type:complete